MTVIKRDGKVEDLEPKKILNSIVKANENVKADEKLTSKQLKRITDSVVAFCETLEEPIDIDILEDVIEKKIMEAAGYEVAKKYITYRYEKERVRNTKFLTEKLTASNVQNQRLRMLPEHAFHPVVEHAGPHRHVVGEPLGLRLAADRKAFRLPDPLGIRIAYNDALFADKRFAVQRDEKRSVHFVHTYPFIAQTGRPDRQARAVIAGATGRPGLRSTITFS